MMVHGAVRLRGTGMRVLLGMLGGLSLFGAEFREPSVGFAMPLEGGFQLAKREEEAVILTSAVTPGLILIKAGEKFTAAEVESVLAGGYRDDGVDLKAAGAAETLGGKYRGAVVTGQLGGSTAKGLLAGLIGPTGECFIVLAATTPEQWPKLEAVARQMVAGIRLTAPEVAPTAAMDQQMMQYLGGVRLRYREYIRSSGSTGRIDGSYSGSEDIYLCGNGTFWHSKRFSANASGVGSTTVTGQYPDQAGRWKTWVTPDKTPWLALEFGNGRVERYQLKPDGQRVYLNGAKYERIQGQGCQTGK